MSDANRLLFLRIALIIIGLTFIFGIYTLGIVWPSGWAWGQGHSHYLMMIIGVYATLGVFLIIASRNPYAHKSLIWFTIWSSVVHAAIMGVQSIQDTGERALGGRCACAYSRCGVPTRLDAGLKIDASADVATMQTRTHEVVQTFGGV
jgi:hypothetical protein